MKYTRIAFATMLVFAFALTGFAGKKGGEKAVIASDNQPQVAKHLDHGSPKAVLTPVEIDSLTHQVATTFYDYMFNSGGPCHVVWYQGRSYMIWIDQQAVGGLRAITYTVYDGATWLAPQPAIPPSTQATYFSGIDVWRGGAADGFAGVAAGWVGSGNSYYSLESAPGQGGFTPTQVTSSRDVQTLVLDSLGTVLFEDSKGRTDYRFWKSTDFGTSWASLNSGLLAYTPGAQVQGSLEPNIVKAPNGDIYVGTMISSSLADTHIDPLGTAPVDSADQWGYFKSTNGGTTWTWTRIAADGAQYNTNHFSLFDNFGQHDMVVDASNRVHGITNGYNFYRYTTVPSDSFATSIDAVYWDATNGFKSLVSFDRTLPILDEVVARRGPSGSVGGNGLGCSYPSIAATADGNKIVATWSQPNFTATTIDTMADGYVTKSIWYNASNDGGATWIGARRLSSQLPARKDEFGIMADRLEVLSPTSVRARILYVSVATGSIGSGADAEAMIYKEFDVSLTTDVREPGNTHPDQFVLEQNYPNPFNPSTLIKYGIPTGTNVKLNVYNALGQNVATLVDGYREAGAYTADFSAANLSSGVYFYTIQAGKFTNTKKMVLMK